MDTGRWSTTDTTDAFEGAGPTVWSRRTESMTWALSARSRAAEDTDLGACAPTVARTLPIVLER